MRRFFLLLIVVLLGLSPVGIPPATAREALECELGEQEYEWWAGICKPVPEEGLAIPVSPDNSDEVIQPYAVAFQEEFAATRPLENAEFMIVYVREGVFVLDRDGSASGTIVASSQYPQIPTLSLIGTAAEVDQPHYALVPGGFLENPDGTACTRACPVPFDQPVQLRAGDIAVAQAGTLCLWCLLGTNAVKDGETGLLEIYVLRGATEGPETFSWGEDWTSTQMRGGGGQDVVAWAFNPPGTRCRGG